VSSEEIQTALDFWRKKRRARPPCATSSRCPGDGECVTRARLCEGHRSGWIADFLAQLEGSGVRRLVSDPA